MKKRETELDILRLMAMMAVIWVHVGGMETDTLPPADPGCRWLIFLKSVMTWEIPVYVMISGRFFLDPDRQMPFSKIVKAISRLVIAFAVWNIVYQAYYILAGFYTGLNWKGIISQALIGPYHFWYLYMITGLYLITPFLRRIAADRQLSVYFIGLFLLFSLLNRYITVLPFIGPTLSQMLGHMHLNFVLGYAGYYVLGCYLRRYPLSDRQEMILYIAGGALILLGAGANTWQSVRDGAYNEWYTHYTAPNTAIAAAAVYTLFTKRISRVRFSEKTIGWIEKLSEYSFGVYLIHALVVALFEQAGLTPVRLHPLLSMPLITLLAFAVTASLVALLRKIPHVGRKIT